MKKFIVLFVLIAVVAVAFAGCKTITPVCATSNPVGNKIGEATSWTLLWGGLRPFTMDLGIYAAAKKGGISKISTVDFELINYLNIYQKYTTRVSGE